MDGSSGEATRSGAFTSCCCSGDPQCPLSLLALLNPQRNSQSNQPASQPLQPDSSTAQRGAAHPPPEVKPPSAGRGTQKLPALPQVLGQEREREERRGESRVGWVGR